MRSLCLSKIAVARICSSGLALLALASRAAAPPVPQAPAGLAPSGTPGTAPPPGVHLQQLTHLDHEHAAREPRYLAAPGEKLGVIWRYPPVDETAKYPTWLPPVCTTYMGCGIFQPGGFRTVDLAFRTFATGPAGVTMAVVRPPGSASQIILHEESKYSCLRDRSDVVIRGIFWDPSARNLVISVDALAILPYDGQSAYYLLQRAQWVRNLEKAAVAKGGKVIEVGPDFKASGPVGPRDALVEYYFVPTDEDYSELAAAAGNRVWLAGTDITQRDRVWIMSSQDGGKSWGDRTYLGIGAYPVVCCPSEHEVVACFTRNGPYGYQESWPDDGYPLAPGVVDNRWPERGPIMISVSTDSGKTWTKPRVAVDNPTAIESALCCGPDGRIWMAYVHSGEDYMAARRTSLWLTSSGDGGKTWDRPWPLTDGKRWDREPDMTFRDGKLRIVFSRAGRGINMDIWEAEVDPSEWIRSETSQPDRGSGRHEDAPTDNASEHANGK